MVSRVPYLLFLLLPVMVVSAVGQERLPDNLGEFYSYGDNYFLEVTTLPGTNPAKGRAVVTFRFSYDLLNFRKTAQAYQKGSVYIATPTLYVEAVATDGVIVDRGVWRDTARVQDYRQTNSKSDFLSGTVELALRPGLYVLKYTFDDETPGSGFTQSTQAFRMDDFHGPSPAIGVPIFLQNIAGDTLVPMSIDGAASFGRRFRVYIPIASADPPKQLRYEVLNPPKKGAEGKGPQVIMTGNATILGKGTLGSAIPAGNNLYYLIDRNLADSSHAYGALIDAPSDELSIGDYILTLSYEAGFNSITDSIRFKLRWVDMPFSLARMEYAIKVLYPIATDETIDRMLGGSREKQVQAIEKFWGERDPTPGTKFNEAMYEYYKRVDYSYFNFKSITQTDGTFTDRGKIYILHGPPTEVNRELQPDSSPREVWIYRNQVNRRFTFVDEARSGEYRLVEYNDL